jgi:hypothetical protein
MGLARHPPCTSTHWTLAAAEAIPREVRLSDAHREDQYRAYRDAIRLRVCAVCLDGADDGTCGLATPPACAIDEHLPRLVEAILDVRSRHDDAYAAAVEAKVCSHCPHRDTLGLCRLRRDGRCTVSVYLPLVIEAVEEVERRRTRPA